MKDRVVFSQYEGPDGKERLVYRTGTIVSTFYEPGDPVQGVSVRDDDGKMYGGLDSQSCYLEEALTFNNPRDLEKFTLSVSGKRFTWTVKNGQISGVTERSTLTVKLNVLPRILRVVGNQKTIEYYLAERVNFQDGQKWIYRPQNDTKDWIFDNELVVFND